MDVTNRIAGMRLLMYENGIDAYLLTGTDPHLSEYTPEYWKTREWISGFTGSYGKILVTKEKVLLWTDTRYFAQALKELEGTGIELMKERVPDTVSLEEWLATNLKPGSVFALDGATISNADVDLLTSNLAAKGIIFNTEVDLVDSLWTNRPSSGNSMVYEHSISYAGKSRSQKIDLVRKILLSKGLDSTIITMLDDLAWLFNIRSTDIKFTPLVVAYAYLDLENVFLFIQQDKITYKLSELLINEGIILLPYEQFFVFLTRIVNKRIHMDPLRTNSKIKNALATSNFVDPSISLITQLKAVKDQNEIDHIKRAHQKDGTAMVYSLFWISQAIGKQKLTEITVGHKFTEFRSKQPFFKGESFQPIVGFGEHGAIIHYHATQQTDSEIKSDNLLLIDTGGQYLDGTTDITRTICLGSANEKQKKDFTICLKAHIALANAIFPVGTKGYSLDSVTRKPLWDNAINYGHGTGHGIGYFLSVHEGPMSIRAEFNNEPIRAGHILSNEPGVYREGEYGIRIENVILCKVHGSNNFGDFLCFETLSLCPIDRHLIDLKFLNIEEIRWINQYHEKVYHEISPHILEKNVVDWLKIQCEPFDEV